MGRRKITDEKTAKPVRGPGRKARKQGEPTFPKELMQTGTKKKLLNFFSHKLIISFFFKETSEKKKISSRGKQRFVYVYFVFLVVNIIFSIFSVHVNVLKKNN